MKPTNDTYHQSIHSLMLGSGNYDAERLQEYSIISQVAHMYYELGMLQPEIAQKLFFSRSKVSRLLTRARELGIVEIRVKRITERAPVMEEKLKSVFPLKDAVVVTNFDGDGEDEEHALDVVTDFAALYVSSLLKGNRVLGVSNGSTVNRVARKITKMQDCHLQVVQLIGSGSNASLAVESRDLVNRISSIFPGESYFLNTPIYMDNVFAREQLLLDPFVANAFSMMTCCDIILTGIGTFDPTRSTASEIIREYQTPEHAKELEHKGAVGSICALYYDIDGNYIPCEWNSKCITIPFQNIRRNEMTVSVACGDRKVSPMLGALRGGLVDVLVTDILTATKVINADSQRGEGSEGRPCVI